MSGRCPVKHGRPGRAHLDLVDVELAVLLLELFVGRLHRIDRRHRVSQILGRDRRLLHVEGLLLQLPDLALVQLLLFQDAQCPLLHRGLQSEKTPREISTDEERTRKGGDSTTHFARAVSHLSHLIAVFGELGVELADLDLDRVDAGIGRRDRVIQRGFRFRARRSKESVHGARDR